VSGTYIDLYSNAEGCDSTIITVLNFHPEYFNSRSVSICLDRGFFAGGAWRTTSGIYYDTFQSVWGCDSILETDLTVADTFRTTIDTTICFGESVYAEGAFQTVSGVYFDNLTSMYGCDSLVVTRLTVLPLPVVDVEGAEFICVGDTVTLNATGNYPTYRWSTGDSSRSISVTQGGLYQVSVTDTFGCSQASLNYFLMESGDFIVSVSPEDTMIDLGQQVQIDLELSQTGLSTQWTPTYFLDCNDCEDPLVSPGFSTDYTVTVVDDVTGCVDTATVSIEVDETLEFFVPNTFTPNGDGNNDQLMVYGNGLTYLNFEIYNRWGELVFQTNDPNVGWDGTYKGEQAPPGVYVYQVKASFGNFVNLPNGHPYKKGSITLIR
jgi:gliding motility-associated-like protein